MADTKGRYTAYIMHEDDLRGMLKTLGTATIFRDEAMVDMFNLADIKPRKVTIIVHRPRVHAKRRAASVNKKRIERLKKYAAKPAR